MEKMHHSSNAEMTEISRERLELPDKKYCDLVGYEIEDYGPAEYIENMEVTNGEYRRARAMLPFSYIGMRASDFDWSVYGEELPAQKSAVNAFILKFAEWQKVGKGLYIFSKTKGSGKTMLSCCLANELMERLDLVVKFISIPELLEMTKKSFSNFSEKTELDSIRKAELLVLDDIGTEMRKEWVDSVLFRLIDWRYTNKLVTIFTSNIEIDKLKLDERITDRIYEMCIPLALPEKSIRRENSNRKNDEFMKRVTEKRPHQYTTTDKGKQPINQA